MGNLLSTKVAQVQLVHVEYSSYRCTICHVERLTDVFMCKSPLMSASPFSQNFTMTILIRGLTKRGGFVVVR